MTPQQPTHFEQLDDETKLKTLSLHFAVSYATALEAQRRGEIDDFEITLSSNGVVRVKTVRT